MTARPALRVVTEDGELLDGCPDCQERDATIAGLEITIRSQAGVIGKQRAALEQDLENHPRRADIHRTIDYWRTKTGHTRSKYSKDRVQLVVDRFKDDFSVDHLLLAIDGLAVFPYRHYAERRRSGPPSERDDQLSVALKSGEAVERFANLGHEARKNGWAQ